jgi:hypothetical protein
MPTDVTTHVGILWISTCCNRSVGRNPAVDRVDGSERINIDLQTGQSLVRAWLESCRVLENHHEI